MNSFFRFKKLDAYPKTVEGVNKQTVLGACLSLLTAGIVILLIYSEITHYTTKHTINHLVVDQTASDGEMAIEFDVTMLKIKCQYLKFSQEVIRGSIHSRKDGNTTMQPTSEGCRIAGQVITDKIGGNLRFKVDNNFLVSLVPQGNVPDLSHTINHISFMPIEDSTNGIQVLDSSKALSDVSHNIRKGVGLFHLNINIVPIHKSSAGKLEIHSHEYSTTHREVALQDLSHGISLAGSIVRDYTGLIFTYDFYPVTIVEKDSQENFPSFLTNLCAIIGGAITLLSLLDRCLHQSVKTVLGKED